MDFWTFLSYCLSLFTELLHIGLFTVTLPDGSQAIINFGSIVVFCILFGFILHLLVPSARGT